MGEWSSTLVVKPMRWSSNRPLRPACENHPLKIRIAMKIKALELWKPQGLKGFSQLVLYLCNRSHLYDKWPPCKSRGHLCNWTSSFQFSGDRTFVCVEPLPPASDLFCAILTLHSSHLSGGHISEQATQSHHCCLENLLNVFRHRTPPAVSYF